jgi:hypothetical protein
MPTTPNLTLPTLTEGQSNGETTVNSSITILDALVACRVEDIDLTAPPISPSAGDTYIVGGSATGDWAGQDGKIAIYDSGWTFIAPVGGQMIFVHDEKELVCYSSAESEWFPVQPRWSTTEHWTGKYGESGSKIYGKCFAGLACPNATTTNHAHSITNLDVSKFMDIEISFNDGTDSAEMNYDLGSHRIYSQIDATNIKITGSTNFSGYTADVRLEYMKT